MDLFKGTAFFSNSGSSLNVCKIIFTKKLRIEHMKLFTISKDGKLTEYTEQVFKYSNQEADLEVLLEKNPEYFFEGSNVLIIGRQVTTNLNTFIDLLGTDKSGNTVIIELKRAKTPRETIAQLLEYASFVETLDYAQLNTIFQDYSGEENNLDDYHQQFFKNQSDEKVSFNKSTRLIIVAQEISMEIQQTAQYLQNKGFDIYCMEFKYFETQAGEKIITSNLTIGDENFSQRPVQSASLPKVDQQQFLSFLDKNGLQVFQPIFEFATKKGLVFRWGSKGFSLNLELNTGFVGLFFGYPPSSVFKQSIYTGFEEITKKVNNPENIITFYREEIKKLGFFVNAKSNLKWVIEKSYTKEEIKGFLDIIDMVTVKIIENGLK
jgi:hypothetical protein